MLTPAQAVLGSLLACFAGVIATWLIARQRRAAGWLAFTATATSSVLALYAAGASLMAGGSEPQEFLRVASLGFALKIHVDGLTAVFLGLIASIALPAAFFSITYLDRYPDYGVARYYPCFLLFLAAMYGLVSTTDMMWFFFIFWQMMTLPGYALIRFEHRKPENVRAANKYLLMMQIACALTMLGAELLAVSSAAASGTTLKYDFDSVSRNLPVLLHTRPVLVATAFALFLVGFGIKLGMWPFGQMWLPDAHPAAPSPVSAMLSGVMIKTGIYGLMRYFLWLVPTEAQGDYPMAGWGLVIAALGTITLFTGTAQALQQEQTKRLLAFHSIGQVGYILLGLGTCLALLPTPNWATVSLAALGFFGALFHTVNHATFKSLLFLNSGSMLWATGTQDLNKLGGLIRFMPVTAVTALIASFSISGVPLFNGFASKWSLLVAAALSGGVEGGSPWALKCLPVFALIALLTSALTLASFVKFFGTSFLSRTSQAVAEKAGRGRLEVGWMMLAPQLFLAALCVGVGLVPAVAFGLMDRAMIASQQGMGAMLARTTPATGSGFAGVAGAQGAAVFAPWVVAAVLGLMSLFAWRLARWARAPRRIAVPWLCGYAREAEATRYGAHQFYGEIKRWFRWLVP
jgi:formate hydrogenlyase subunit 3/multisubunit Na+/H+ antiporter MnhD subunit